MQPEDFERILNTVRLAVTDLYHAGKTRLSTQSVHDWDAGQYGLTTSQIVDGLLGIVFGPNPILKPHFTVRCKSETDPTCNKVFDLPFESFDALDRAAARQDEDEDDLICTWCKSPLPLGRSDVMVLFDIDQGKFLKKKSLAS